MSTQSNYNNWISAELAWRQEAHGFQSQEQFYEECLLFVTVTFDQREMAVLRATRNVVNCDLEMNAGAFLYWAAGYLLDLKNGSAVPKDRPFATMAVDYNGSKACGFQEATRDNLHLHSLWAAHPQDVTPLLRVLTGTRMKMMLRKHGVKSVDVRPFDTSKSLAQATEYMFKAWHKSQFSPNSLVDFDITRGDLSDPLPKFRLRTLIPSELEKAPLKRYRKELKGDVAGLFAWDDISDSDDPILAVAA